MERRSNTTITGDVNALAALLLCDIVVMAYIWNQFTASVNKIYTDVSTQLRSQRAIEGRCVLSRFTWEPSNDR